MLIQVYRYIGDVTRSVVRATLVAEVEADVLPDDDFEFAAEHGGDFIEVSRTLAEA